MAARDIFFYVLAESALDIGDRVGRIFERTQPALMQNRSNDLVDHGVPQLLLACEMMEERALGGSRRFHNVVQAAALESVLVNLLKRTSRDLSQRGCRC